MKSSNTVCHTFRSIAQFHLCALTYVLNFCWNTDLISIRTIAATCKVDFSCDETPGGPGSIPRRALKIHYFWNALTGSKHFFHKRSWFFYVGKKLFFVWRNHAKRLNNVKVKWNKKPLRYTLNLCWILTDLLLKCLIFSWSLASCQKGLYCWHCVWFLLRKYDRIKSLSVRLTQKSKKGNGNETEGQS